MSAINRPRYALGANVTLTAERLVHGNVGIYVDGQGDSVSVEMVCLAVISDYVKGKWKVFDRIIREAGAGGTTPPATEAGDSPGLGALAAALRVRDDAAKVAGDEKAMGVPAADVPKIIGLGDSAATPIHPPDFVRVLPIEADVNGAPFRDFRLVATALKPVKHPKWPLTGPRCAIWCLCFCIAQCGGAFGARLQQLMSLAKLTYGDKRMTEYAVIAKTLEYLSQWDQMHFGNSVGIELLCRRLSLIEEKYRYRLPQFDGNSGKDCAFDAEADASIFLGLGSATM